MKSRILISILLVLFVVSGLTAQRRMRGFWRQEWRVENGDSIPVVHILPIRKYARRPDMRRYQRLIRMVKKCYPLAKQVRVEMDRMEKQLLAVKDKKEQEITGNREPPGKSQLLALGIVRQSLSAQAWAGLPCPLDSLAVYPAAPHRKKSY